MSVWLVIPSKRPPAEVEPVLAKWRDRGYAVAVWCDAGSEYPKNANQVMTGEAYPGYAQAVNELAKFVLHRDPSCDWIIAAGDDTYPDPNMRADEISQECRDYFWMQYHDSERIMPEYRSEPTFGVMQPTGDPWEDSHPGEKRLIRRVAGSPWLGREWCLRANQGKGPLWPEFFHMFADETLQCVAQQLGVFWQREDLTQHHAHWGRPKPGERIGHASNMPDFLVKANSPAEWNKSKAEFERLKAGGFKECLPL
jgi:hypothetical protein